MTPAQQLEQDNFQLSFKKRKQEAALRAARKILAKREDPHFMKVVLYNFISEITGLSDQDLLALEINNFF